MEIRYATHPEDSKNYTTEEIRSRYVVTEVFKKDDISLTYSHVDRIIFGGAMPVEKSLSLKVGKELGVAYFLERREMGIINVGGRGSVVLDGVKYTMERKDGLYVGMGVKDVAFHSDDPASPAKFYINSVPAHKSYPIVKIDIKKANTRVVGDPANMNRRTIYQYINPSVCKTCQLQMGLTMLEPNNGWNTMPCHTHDRRMEVYFYFDLGENDRVFHFMGEPNEVRTVVLKNEQAIISPSWSIHSGVGTSNYTFIWGMCGENQTYDDMDIVPMEILE